MTRAAKYVSPLTFTVVDVGLFLCQPFQTGHDTTWQPCPKQKRRWGGKRPLSFCCYCSRAAASADFSNSFSVWSFPHFPWICHILPTKSFYISGKKFKKKNFKKLHKWHEHISLYKESDNVHPCVCARVENIYQSLPMLLLLSNFTSVIPTPGTISK